MKKVILIAILGLGNLANAQNLEQKLEDNKNQLLSDFDLYMQKKISNQTLSNDKKNLDKLQKTLQNKRERLAFLFNNRPYFLKAFDTDQIKNSNTDAIQEGKIDGLNGSFNGEGIHISVFDGGRVYAQHKDFGDAKRITQKEKSSVPYDAHATGVTGMIGAIGHNISGTENGKKISGNTKGIAPKTTFDSYAFITTTLAGENKSKSVSQKLLDSKANISNHSYGVQLGWEWQEASIDNAGDGWYWSDHYDPKNKEIFSLEGTYFKRDKEYDDIVYHNPSMIVVKAAGNSFGDGPSGTNDKKYYSSDDIGNINGYIEFDDSKDTIPNNNCSQGYDCIGDGSLAKNLIIVGATEKITRNNGRYTQASDVVKSSFSSAGPRDDGAIKPDIAGVGSNIFHASTSGLGSNDWDFGGGTSYSSPQVTGIIALWTEINKSLFNNQLLNAASAKTLLIHSALEAGNKGPDAHFGWGFANAKKGAELLVDKSNNKIIFEDKTLKNNAKDEILVETDGTQPLKVTISWIDPSFKNIPVTWKDAYNNRASRLVNDLDLRIINIKTNQVYYPWKLDINSPIAPATTGDNLVDNVEQVVIEKPEAGVYRIEVSHKGNLVNNDDTPKVAPQDYSILASGYKKIATIDENNQPPVSVINIYPTLITDNSNIHISYTENIESISVYDMAGRLLKQEQINALSHTLDFGKFVKGVYVLRVTAGKETISKKILKR